ncbi:MAG: hypothetical protein HY548_07230, partial [Elusimicrobia bacterium]|nr:hypothetical protein [Elusimicrobiota bacterium]
NRAAAEALNSLLSDPALHQMEGVASLLRNDKAMLELLDKFRSAQAEGKTTSREDLVRLNRAILLRQYPGATLNPRLPQTTLSAHVSEKEQLISLRQELGGRIDLSAVVQTGEGNVSSDVSLLKKFALPRELGGSGLTQIQAGVRASTPRPGAPGQDVSEAEARKLQVVPYVSAQYRLAQSIVLQMDAWAQTQDKTTINAFAKLTRFLDNNMGSYSLGVGYGEDGTVTQMSLSRYMKGFFGGTEGLTNPRLKVDALATLPLEKLQELAVYVSAVQQITTTSSIGGKISFVNGRLALGVELNQKIPQLLELFGVSPARTTAEPEAARPGSPAYSFDQMRGTAELSQLLAQTVSEGVSGTPWMLSKMVEEMEQDTVQFRADISAVREGLRKAGIKDAKIDGYVAGLEESAQALRSEYERVRSQMSTGARDSREFQQKVDEIHRRMQDQIRRFSDELRGKVGHRNLGDRLKGIFSDRGYQEKQQAVEDALKAAENMQARIEAKYDAFTRVMTEADRNLQLIRELGISPDAIAELDQHNTRLAEGAGGLHELMGDVLSLEDAAKGQTDPQAKQKEVDRYVDYRLALRNDVRKFLNVDSAVMLDQVPGGYAWLDYFATMAWTYDEQGKVDWTRDAEGRDQSKGLQAARDLMGIMETLKPALWQIMNADASRADISKMDLGNAEMRDLLINVSLTVFSSSNRPATLSRVQETLSGLVTFVSTNGGGLLQPEQLRVKNARDLIRVLQLSRETREDWTTAQPQAPALERVRNALAPDASKPEFKDFMALQAQVRELLDGFFKASGDPAGFNAENPAHRNALTALTSALLTGQNRGQIPDTLAVFRLMANPDCFRVILDIIGRPQTPEDLAKFREDFLAHPDNPGFLKPAYWAVVAAFHNPTRGTAPVPNDEGIALSHLQNVLAMKAKIERAGLFGAEGYNADNPQHNHLLSQMTFFFTWNINREEAANPDSDAAKRLAYRDELIENAGRLWREDKGGQTLTTVQMRVLFNQAAIMMTMRKSIAEGAPEMAQAGVRLEKLMDSLAQIVRESGRLWKGTDFTDPNLNAADFQDLVKHIFSVDPDMAVLLGIEAGHLRSGESVEHRLAVIREAARLKPQAEAALGRPLRASNEKDIAFLYELAEGSVASSGQMRTITQTSQRLVELLAKPMGWDSGAVDLLTKLDQAPQAEAAKAMNGLSGQRSDPGTAPGPIFGRNEKGVEQFYARLEQLKGTDSSETRAMRALADKAANLVQELETATGLDLSDQKPLAVLLDLNQGRLKTPARDHAANYLAALGRYAKQLAPLFGQKKIDLSNPQSQVFEIVSQYAMLEASGNSSGSVTFILGDQSAVEINVKDLAARMVRLMPLILNGQARTFDVGSPQTRGQVDRLSQWALADIVAEQAG